MARNNQPGSSHEFSVPPKDDLSALTRFLNWMKSAVGCVNAPVYLNGASHTPTVAPSAPALPMDPALMGLPLLVKFPSTSSSKLVIRMTPPTVRLPVRPRVPRTIRGSNRTKTQHENNLRRRFKL